MLLIAVLAILFRKELIAFKPEQLAPTQQGKVENFITECIDHAGQDALTKVGLQAGYIEVPSLIAKDGSKHLKTSPFTVVAYWAYGPTTNIPPLTTIKQQIDRYMEQHVQTCLLESKAFQETYTLVEKGPLQADTKILDNKVMFDLHWDVEIRDKAGEIVTEIIEHTSNSPVKLKKIHETASRIVEQEMKTLKFEDLTQDLISLEHANLPIAGFDFSCQQKKWEVHKAKETLQDMLRINLREVKVPKTDAVDFPKELPYYQNHYYMDLGPKFSNPQLQVLFSYEIGRAHV